MFCVTAFIAGRVKIVSRHASAEAARAAAFRLRRERPRVSFIAAYNAETSALLVGLGRRESC